MNRVINMLPLVLDILKFIVGVERGTERSAGFTELGWSEERLFRRSHSVHMLC